MFAALLTPAYLPFAIAFVVMAGIGLIEAVGLGLGNADLGADADGGALDWLGRGREVPILIWLTSLLGCFTQTGLAIQQLATAITGAPLFWPIAAGAALVAGGLLNAVVARGLARVMPGYESSAISTDDLLRERGRVLDSAAARGRPARAKITDRHGQAHVVMVEPHDDADVLATGSTVLIVRRDGALFFALPETNSLLHTV